MVYDYLKKKKVITRGYSDMTRDELHSEQRDRPKTVKDRRRKT